MKCAITMKARKMTYPKIGTKFQSELLLTEYDIINGAKFVGDNNPIHNEPDHPHTLKLGSLIASGSHVSGLFSALIPSYFGDHGHVLGVNMEFSFKKPIFPNKVYKMVWVIVRAEPNESKGSVLYSLEGHIKLATEQQVLISTAKIVLYI